MAGMRIKTKGQEYEKCIMLDGVGLVDGAYPCRSF